MNFEPGRLQSTAINPRAEIGASAITQTRSITLRIRAFLALFVLDCICIFASFFVAGSILGRPFEDVRWLVIVVILIPLYFGTASNCRAFSVQNLMRPLHASAKTIQAMLLALSALAFIAFSLKAGAQFPRTVASLGSLLSILSLAVVRYFYVKSIATVIGKDLFHTVVICDDGKMLPTGDFSVLIASDLGLDPETHDPIMLDRMAKALSVADRVVVACDANKREAWARTLKGLNIRSEITMPELDALAPLGVGNHEDVATLIVAQGPLGLFDRFVKRSFDLAVALAALVLLWPVMLLVAVAIRLESAGPALFKQVRIGRGNVMFEMWKFRSMRTDRADASGNRLTDRNDDRVTRVGQFIRRTSIDELPQIFQVLAGQMSVVGPRPHALGAKAANKLYWEVDERYWARHAAKPGLTGLAQVRGHRGNTIVEDDLVRRLQSDLEYLDHWTIWRDMVIVARTIGVLAHRNAF
jgi:polysaccharide biosynthesis protein PslA